MGIGRGDTATVEASIARQITLDDVLEQGSRIAKSNAGLLPHFEHDEDDEEDEQRRSGDVEADDDGVAHVHRQVDVGQLLLLELVFVEVC